MEFLNQILNFTIYQTEKHSLHVSDLVWVAFVILLTVWSLRLLKKFLFRKKKTELDDGNLYALFQIGKYIFWTVALLVILELLGIKLNVLWASSAALLVGLGLGVQQTFTDLASGIIILLEGSIKVGDILEVENDVLKIQKIGLRTSEAIDRDDIYSIIPNSHILQNRIINWSHQSKKTRFKVYARAAYGSDVNVVIQLLKESAAEHPQVFREELIYVRLIEFAPYALEFELLFYSDNIFRIENVKSEVRIIINRKFAEHNIQIPYPQQDVWLKPKQKNNIKDSQ